MEKTLGEMLFEYRVKNNLSIKQVADMEVYRLRQSATWKEVTRSAEKRNSWLSGFVKE